MQTGRLIKRWGMDCPLCRLCRHDAANYDPAFPQDLKTRLVYESAEVIVVIDHAKGYTRRYLGVVKEHISDREMTDARLNNLTEATLIAAVVDCRTHGGRIADMNILEHSIPDHAYVQVCVQGGPCT